MNESVEVVKDQDGNQWELSMGLPETLDEAIEIYKEDGALAILNAGLKVKKQNIGRTAMKQGKTREEAESLMASYRPGQTTRKSKKLLATQAIMDNGLALNEDVELKASVSEAFVANDWDKVISLLGVADTED
jgi:hypothetical protein